MTQSKWDDKEYRSAYMRERYKRPEIKRKVAIYNKQYKKYHRERETKRYKKWREEHSEHMKDYERQRSRERRKQLKIEVIKYYSDNTNRCACCKEGNIIFLTIDHIKGGGHLERKKFGANTYLHLKRNGFPSGYQVLCYNCNCAKRASNKCPHQL